MPTQPNRAHLAGTALGLILLGGLFVRVLVADGSDNAYFYLGALGMGLLMAAVPFALAALLPVGAMRRTAARIALGFVSVIGLLGLVLLAFAVVLIPSQNYQSGEVLASHVVGLLLLVAALIALLTLYRRRA